MEGKFDVIVIGAGPSGSCAASLLAEKGLKVCLLEKDRFPRQKVCGDGISGQTKKLLEELKIYPEFGGLKRDIYPIKQSIMSSPDGTVMPMDANELDEKSFGFTCPRDVFDEVLLSFASKKGALLKEGVRVKGIESIDDRLNAVYADFGGRDIRFLSTLTIIANGSGSNLVHQVRKRKINSKDIAIGMRTYFEGVDLQHRCEIHYDKHLLPCYGWLFPISDSIVNVGIAMRVDLLRRSRKSITSHFYKFISENQFVKLRLHKAKPMAAPSAHIMKLGTGAGQNYGSRFLIVGDAGSFVDPINGEGISNALLTGRIAAEVGYKAFEQDNFSKSFLKQYEDRWKEKLAARFRTAKIMQWLLQRPAFVNFNISKMSKKSQFNLATERPDTIWERLKFFYQIMKG